MFLPTRLQRSAKARVKKEKNSDGKTDKNSNPDKN